MDSYIEIDFIEVYQPIGIFYIGSIGWKDLLAISGADIRKIHSEDDKSDSFDSYLGIQRKISGKRIEEISKYVHTLDATFPTSIILHIEPITRLIGENNVKDLDESYIDDHMKDIVELRNIELDEKRHKLKIRNNDKVARILDGQHRIEGLKAGFENEADPPKFQFNVTIFVNLDIDDQAQIFSVINKAQTKVNKSLVYDLFDYARFRSPQKTSHDIVRLMNRMSDSPFYRKIKILGTAEDKDKETIAQATLVELIMKYISDNPMLDRDTLRKKTIFGNVKLELLTNENDIEKLFFRNFFVNENDAAILETLTNYFSVIKEKWNQAWTVNNQGNILNKSTGVIALMRFLRFAVRAIGNYTKAISASDFHRVFEKIALSDNDFTTDNYKPGSSGQAKLLADLRQYL